MKRDRPKWWSAVYQISGQQVPIPGVATSECPVSLINGYSTALIDLNNRQGLMEDVNILGDASKLPAKMIDGLEVLALERRQADVAIADFQRNKVTIERD